MWGLHQQHRPQPGEGPRALVSEERRPIQKVLRISRYSRLNIWLRGGAKAPRGLEIQSRVPCIPSQCCAQGRSHGCRVSPDPGPTPAMTLVTLTPCFFPRRVSIPETDTIPDPRPIHTFSPSLHASWLALLVSRRFHALGEIGQGETAGARVSQVTRDVSARWPHPPLPVPSSNPRGLKSLRLWE